MRVLGFFFGILLILNSPAFSQGDPLAHASSSGWSLERFREHTLSHKARVQWLMLFVNELFPEPLPSDLVLARAQIHDNAKVSDEIFVMPPFLGRAPEVFKAIGYLHQMMGVDLRRLPEDFVARSKALAIISEVNRRDARNELEFLKAWGLLDGDGRVSSEGHQLRRLEMIADLVDRGLDPDTRLEFNRMPMKLASEILQDPQDKHLARIAEASYSRIFSKSEPPKLSMRLSKLCQRGVEAIHWAQSLGRFQLRLHPL